MGGNRFAEEEGDEGFNVELDPDNKYVDKVDSDFDESESSLVRSHCGMG